VKSREAYHDFHFNGDAIGEHMGKEAKELTRIKTAVAISDDEALCHGKMYIREPTRNNIQYARKV
jgi:hypothetical protein